MIRSSFQILRFRHCSVVALAFVVTTWPSQVFGGSAACCVDGVCQNVVTQAECDALGGTFPGDGRPCEQTVCPPAVLGACCHGSFTNGCLDGQTLNQC